MDVTRQITDGFAVVAECLAPTGIFPDFRHVPRQYIARIDKNVMCPRSVRINLRIIHPPRSGKQLLLRASKTGT